MESSLVVSVLAEVYAQRGIAADQLPYTEEFEHIYEEVNRRAGASLSRAQLWRLMTNARKRGSLPRLAR